MKQKSLHVFRFTIFTTLVKRLSLVFLYVLSTYSHADVDTTGEQYRDIQKSIINEVIGSVPGELYDAVTGTMRHYATDFYIPGNGDLPITLERTLDTDGHERHELGNMRLLYSRLEIDEEYTLFHYWPSSVYCNPETYCYPHDPDSAISRVPNACVSLRHSYVMGAPAVPGDNTLVYKGVEFPAPKFYAGAGKYIKFLHRNGTDSRFPENAKFVSRNNWYIDCVDSATMNVHAPTGVVYEVKRQILTGSYFDQGALITVNVGPVDRYYTSRIIDKWGNSLTFNYNKPLSPTVHITATQEQLDDYDHPKLTGIVASDGRELTVIYNGDRVSRIADNSSNQRVLDYHYQSNPIGGFDLRQITRSDGMEWSFVYDHTYLFGHEDQIIGSRVSLRNFTSPEGLNVSYLYDYWRPSCEFYDTTGIFTGGTCGLGEVVPVLSSRTVSGQAVTNGNYSFSYRKVSNRAITTINTPSGKHEVEFGRLNYFDRPANMPAESGKPTRHTLYKNDGVSVARETLWTWARLYDVVDLSWFNTKATLIKSQHLR